MKNFFLVLLMIIWSTLTFVQGTEIDSKEFDTYINRAISDAGIAGMGIAIVSDDSIIFTNGYGYADIQNKLPFTPNTVMNIASISKTFVGVAIMHAVENYLLNLDDDVNNILPFTVLNPNSPESIITLRHLMSHMSGIQDENTVYGACYHYGGDSPTPLGEFLEDYLSPNGKNYSKNNFIDNKPGEKFEYSNIGAGLAGYIVEIVTGKPLNVITREIIFEPLGMHNTCWFLSEMAISKHSKLYESTENNTVLKEIQLYGLTTYPDGGVRTTITDLSYYLLCIMNNGSYREKRILKEASIVDMLTPDYIDSYTKFWEKGEEIGHGGRDPGVSTRMSFDPKEKRGIIIFINTSSYGNFKKAEKKIYEFGKSILLFINNNKK
jgi:CubicO group peptidase (beta-lactamase class C family)